MTVSDPLDPVRLFRAPAHAIIAPLGAAFLFGALITDLLYIVTLNGQWETFSIWLLTLGLIFTLATAVTLLVDLIGGHGALRMAWGPFLAGFAAGALSLVNAFVHSRDGYTAVVPEGVLLSLMTALFLMVMARHHWSMTRFALPVRRRTSVDPI